MESYHSLSSLQRTQDSIVSKAFHQAIHHLQLPSTIHSLDPSIRRHSIRIILSDLQANLDGKTNWSSDTVLSALVTLKLLGRSSIATDDLLSHFPLLIRYANLLPTTPPSAKPNHPPPSLRSNPSIAQESLRILSNALLLHPLSRSSVDLLPALNSLVELAFDHLVQSHDPILQPQEVVSEHDANQDVNAFLASRLIFLITAASSSLVVELIERTSFIPHLHKTFRQETTKSPDPPSHPRRPVPRDTRIEHLKIIFNAMVHYPKSVQQFGHVLVSPTHHSSHPDSQSPASRHPSFKQRLINQINRKKLTRRTSSDTSSIKDQQESCQEPTCDHDSQGLNHSTNSLASSSGPHSKASSRLASMRQDAEALVSVPDPLNNIFSGLLPCLVQFFLIEPLPHPPSLRPPLISYIHTFLNFSPSAHWFFTNNYRLPDKRSSDINIPIVIDKLFMILDRVTEYYCPGNPDDISVKNKCQADGIDLDVDLTQVFLLTSNLISPHTLPDGSSPAGLSPKSRKSLIEKIVPSTVDRATPLNKHATFIGRVLRLISSIRYETLKHVCGGFLCALYGGDTDLLVSQVGYGPLAGYFVSIGKPGLNPDSKHPTPADINPITGAHWSSTESDDSTSPSMSDFDKEQEAERLCELFDRMNRGGVMSVQDPRKLAVDSGRFQQIEEALNVEQEEQDKIEEMKALKELEEYKKKKTPKESSQ